jgi:hypothetical protein
MMVAIRGTETPFIDYSCIITRFFAAGNGFRIEAVEKGNRDEAPVKNDDRRVSTVPEY